jgi:hypothetical protein
MRGATNSKDIKAMCFVNSFAYILAVIFPHGRIGCHKSDRRSTTGVEREKNSKLPGLQKQHFLGKNDVITT